MHFGVCWQIGVLFKPQFCGADHPNRGFCCHSLMAHFHPFDNKNTGFFAVFLLLIYRQFLQFILRYHKAKIQLFFKLNFVMSEKSSNFAADFRISTVGVVQLVRAPDCGSGGRGFEPHLPPSGNKKADLKVCFFCLFLSQRCAVVHIACDGSCDGPHYRDNGTGCPACCACPIHHAVHRSRNHRV